MWRLRKTHNEKNILNFSLLLMVLSSFAQKSVKLSLLQQPSNEVYISLFYSKVANPMAIGQGFSYKIENLTNDEIDVYFDIVAKLFVEMKL